MVRMLFKLKGVTNEIYLIVSQKATLVRQGIADKLNESKKFSQLIWACDIESIEELTEQNKIDNAFKEIKNENKFFID